MGRASRRKRENRKAAFNQIAGSGEAFRRARVFENAKSMPSDWRAADVVNMIGLRDLFPSTVHRAPEVAESMIDLDTEESVNDAIAFAEVMISEAATSGGTIAMEMTASELLNDVLQARERMDHLGIALLQLAIAVIPLDQWCALRRFENAWKWATSACSPTPVTDTKADIDLAMPFQVASRYSNAGSPRLASWVGSICYLAWSSSYLNDAATAIAPMMAPIQVDYLSRTIAAEVPCDEEFLISSAHVASFLHKVRHPLARDLVVVLDEIYTSHTLEIRHKAQLACLLAGPLGEYTEVPGPLRANEALNAMGSALIAHQRLQLLSMALRSAGRA